MGSGNAAPGYVDPNEELLGTEDQEVNMGPFGGKRKVPGKKGMAGGKDAFNYAMNMMKTGLPADLKADYEKKFTGSMGGQLRSGEQDLKERYASMGDVPLGAQNDAYSKLRAGANSATNDFYGGLLEKDFGARQQGFGNFSTLQQMAQSLSNSKNQYGMEKYKIDEENRFKWGDFISGLAKGAGSYFGG